MRPSVHFGDFDEGDAGDDRTVQQLIDDPTTDWGAVERLGEQMAAIDNLPPADAKAAAKAWAAELEGDS